MLLGNASPVKPCFAALLPLHKDRQSKALQLLDFVSFFLRKKEDKVSPSTFKSKAFESGGEDFVEGKESKEKNIAYNWVLSLVA